MKSLSKGCQGAHFQHAWFMLDYYILLENSRKLWLSKGLRTKTLELGGSGRKPIVCWRYYSGVSLCASNSYFWLSNLTVSSMATIEYFCCIFH